MQEHGDTTTRRDLYIPLDSEIIDIFMSLEIRNAPQRGERGKNPDGAFILKEIARRTNIPVALIEHHLAEWQAGGRI